MAVMVLLGGCGGSQWGCSVCAPPVHFNEASLGGLREVPSRCAGSLCADGQGLAIHVPRGRAFACSRRRKGAFLHQPRVWSLLVLQAQAQLRRL